MSQQLSAAVLQEMLNEDYKTNMKRYSSYYDEKRPGKSPADISQDLHEDVFVTLSGPLKKMQAAYLNDVSKNCYAAKYMDSANPNAEQIQICRDEKRIKHLGKWEDKLENTRDSNLYRYQECMNDAENNIAKAMTCIEGYNTGMAKDNLSLENWFRGEYSKFC